MMIRLKTSGAIAGIVNCRCALSSPVANPESARNTIETNITRVRPTAIVSTCGLVRRYPGAATRTNTGAASTPPTTIASPIPNTSVNVLLVTRRTSSSSPRSNTWVIAGMKTMLSVPPRNNRWTKKGREYAMTNADLTPVAPNSAAMMTSRMSPSARLETVPTAMIPAALARPRAATALGGPGVASSTSPSPMSRPL
jgi:hypothetical protein